MKLQQLALIKTVRVVSEIIQTNRAQINQWLSQAPYDQLIVIADSEVWKLYQGQLDFNIAKYKLIVWQNTPGESCKTLNHYSSCIEFLLSQGIHRFGHVLALGGGATTDFAGFVASTLLRGVTWSAIPTTLLAMVDAAIGGKTALNSSSGKNLIGTFHPPERVWLCTDFLQTLPNDELRSGMGEILKYCLLSDQINQAVRSSRSIEDIVGLCAEYKLWVVENDPAENGSRRVLNYGHTFGHAFERTFGYEHGLAVALGIQFILDLYQANPTIRSEYDSLVEILGLEFTIDLYKTSMWRLSSETDALQLFLDLVNKDKKKIDSCSIEVVLVEEIGFPIRRKVDSTMLIQHARNLIAKF